MISHLNLMICDWPEFNMMMYGSDFGRPQYAEELTFKNLDRALFITLFSK